MGRANTLITNATWSLPSHVETYVKSETHSWRLDLTLQCHEAIAFRRGYTLALDAIDFISIDHRSNVWLAGKRQRSVTRCLLV